MQLTSADAVVHGTRLHYYRSGGDRPPLVMVHGITDDGLCWTPVAEVLSAHFDTILVDMRGHGKSEAPETGYSIENMARELAGFLQALKLEKPSLLGHSMGAITSLVMAGMFPDLPRAILLEDPPAFWVPPVRRADDTPNTLAIWIEANKRKTGEELFAECRANPNWSEAEFGLWVDSKHRYSPRIIALVEPQAIHTSDYPLLMKSVACPALFISADRQLGAISGEDDIAKLKSWIPQLVVEHIAGAGHSIHRDQFARYIEVVQRYLTGLVSQ